MKIECDELLVICDNCGHAIHVKELDNNLIKLNNKNDKLISIQDAIDALIEWYGCEPNGMDYFKEILAKKSSAQLTQNNRVNSNNALDTISRQAAMEDISKQQTYKMFEGEDRLYLDANDVGSVLASLPSVQPERDIPMKPNETIDTAWGIRKKQAVCPKCDYYLGRVEFIGNPNGKKITYCETCGQAIDWEGWEWDE